MNTQTHKNQAKNTQELWKICKPNAGDFVTITQAEKLEFWQPTEMGNSGIGEFGAIIQLERLEIC